MLTPGSKGKKGEEGGSVRRALVAGKMFARRTAGKMATALVYLSTSGGRTSDARAGGFELDCFGSSESRAEEWRVCDWAGAGLAGGNGT